MLKGPAAKYETFVRNRIQYITSNGATSIQKKIADLLTRGVMVDTLVDNQLWLHGPPWLINNQQKIPIKILDEIPGIRVTCITFNENLIIQFSLFDKLVKIITLINTFIVRLRSKCETTTANPQQAINQIYKIS